MTSVKSLCILRLSAIGDVCHAVAMVTRIRRTRPDIKITWIVGKVEHLLLQHIPNIEFIVFDKSLGKHAFTNLKKQLGKDKFDAMFVMQVAFRANWAARLVKAKVKIGFDWQRSKELHWLFANKRIAPKQYAHVLDGFMGFADALSIPPSELAWDLPVSDNDYAFATAECGDTNSYAVISPAASKAERNWSAQNYAAIADYLNAQGKKVVLCGGPGPLDKALSEEIQRHTSNIDVDLIGKTSLIQMLAALDGAALVVAPDTGPAHMATMVGTPIIGLYAHSNPRRTGPYLSQDYTVSVYDQVIKEQTGKDWQALPWGKRAKGVDLMSRIQLKDVQDKVDLILNV